MSLSSEYIRTSLQSSYGDTVTSADIRAWCAMNGANYQTVSKKIDSYKISRGKWNLTVTEQLEQTYQVSLLLCLQLNKTLFLKKMIPSSSLATSVILKKLFSPVYSIQRSLQDCPVTERLSRLNRRVLNWVGNLSV